MTRKLAKKNELSKVGVIILRFSPQISYQAYDQHALNNQKKLQDRPKKKVVRGALGTVFKGLRKIFKNFCVLNFLWRFK